MSSPVRMGAPKDSLEARKVLPAGRYQVRLDGFKPKLSKLKPGKDQSVNFNPDIKIINHAQLNGEKVYTPLNQQVGFILEAFSHCFGHPLEVVGDSAVLPGGFQQDVANPQDIAKMTYQGPLQGATGELELGVMTGTNGKPQNFIKQFFCKVPGCKTQHPTELT